MIIKVNYKGKRISIPVAYCDNKNLSEVVMPHILRFEHEVLRKTMDIKKTAGSVERKLATGRQPRKISFKTTTSRPTNQSKYSKDKS